MTTLPSGTVTFLFTDIQGSTRLWQSNPHPMKNTLARHDEILREAIETNDGYVFKTVGDAFCGAFHTAMDGLNASLQAQLAIRSEIWDSRTPIRVRMALHTGEAIERNNDYYGPALNRTARLESIGYGGQTLVSLVSTELVRDMLPDGVGLKELGRRRLKDLTRPESVFQLVHAELEEEFPPLKSIDLHPHNLPVQPTALIGREKIADKLCTMLTTGGTRLVTLTGTGGIGKTRLALQIAAELVDRFVDGAFFVDLTSAKTPEEAAAAVASVFKIKEAAQHRLTDTVLDFLSDRDQLLVLDNLEQIPAAGSLIARLLAVCGGIRILATSREALRLKGERKVRVPPLPVPKLIAVSGEDVKYLTEYESVRLFVERAKAVDDTFELDDRNAPAVAEICVKLDGIPLAMELAASRINVLEPNTLLERLSERFKVLTHGAYDLPQRQQTLRNTIDWSYDLLDDPLRIAFSALSVFSGGFDLEAAETVLPAVEPGVDILEGVTALLEKSMLIKRETPFGIRFDMLESLRLYAAQRAAEFSIEERILPPFADYFLSLCSRLAGEFDGENQAGVLARYNAEYANIRRAFRWFFEKKDKRCADLLIAMWKYCSARGRYSDARTSIDEVLRGGFDLGIETRTQLLTAAGVLARSQGSFKDSRIYLQAGLKEIYRTGFDEVKCGLLHHLGWTYERMNKLQLAEDLFSRCEISARKAGDHVSLGMALNGQGHIAIRNGRIKEADRYLKESMQLLSRKGNIRAYAFVIGNYALLKHRLRDRRAAIRLSKKSAELLSTLGERDQIKLVYNNLASIYEELDEYDQALDYWHLVRKLAVETGDRRALSNAHAGISKYYIKHNNPEAARFHGRAAHRAAERMKESSEYATSLRLLAEIHLSCEETERAKELFMRSIAILETAHEPDELALAHEGLARCPIEN